MMRSSHCPNLMQIGCNANFLLFSSFIFWRMKSGNYISFFLSYFNIFQYSNTLGSRGYFFLIDISRRSRVNEAQSAEEKNITSGHRSTQPHFHRDPSSEIELGHRSDTPMSTGNKQYNNGPDWLHRTTSLHGIEKPVSPLVRYLIGISHGNEVACSWDQRLFFSPRRFAPRSRGFAAKYRSEKNILWNPG